MKRWISSSARSIPLLKRLEAKGWLASGWEKSECNRRAKFYRLTAVTGKKQLSREHFEMGGLRCHGSEDHGACSRRGSANRKKPYVSEMEIPDTSLPPR